MEEDLFIKSEVNKAVLQNIIFSSVCFFLWSVVFLISILEPSWYACIFSLFFFLIFLGSFINFYKKIYYINNEKIVVATHKNEYIDEVLIKDIIAWNNYTISERGGKRHILYITTSDKYIYIEKSDYINFDELVDFFTSLNILKDERLELKWNNKTQEIFSKIDNTFVVIMLLAIPIYIFIFWLIINAKPQTNRVMCFEGIIQHIEYYKKNHYISIGVSNHPNIKFEFHENKDVKYFKEYIYENGKQKYAHLNKHIIIAISKDDYDWKINNRFIKAININSSTSFTAEHYAIKK